MPNGISGPSHTPATYVPPTPPEPQTHVANEPAAQHHSPAQQTAHAAHYAHAASELVQHAAEGARDVARIDGAVANQARHAARTVTELASADAATVSAARSAVNAGRVARAAHTAGTAAAVVGAAATAVNQYQTSTATTGAGRVVDAGLAGAVSGVLATNPAIAAADIVTGGGVSNTTSASVHALTTAGEAATQLATTGDPTQVDTRGMDEFHRRSVNGELGRVSQAASQAGDYWADNGVGGGLRDFWRQVTN
ncbi:MAG: hypothetical protein HYV63_13975 [Candidatus Schekmanbacteria bacterium]|nr:hypothetical protein [Candidatus Schekmanbacteria bacterium]